MIELNFVDNFIIISYLVFTLIIGLIFSVHKEQNSLDYFLAGRNLKWYMVGISLFASSISGGYLIAATGFEISSSYLVSHAEMLTVIFFLLLCAYFGPKYIKANVFSTSEFLEKRFDRNSRIYVALFQVLTNIFIRITVILFAGGLILKQVLDWDTFTTTLVLVLLSGLYSVVGGLKAVIYTQIVQTVFLFSAVILLGVYGLHAAGWISGLLSQPTFGSVFFLKPTFLPNLPLLGIVLGVPIIGFWYWCTDQTIIQRILSAKSITDAKRGAYLAILLKIIFISSIAVIGLLTIKLSLENKSDQSFSLIVSNGIFPSGVKGIFIIGIFSLIMSSLSSLFNSTSALLTMDFYRMAYPNASQRKLVLVGRLSTTFTVLLVILCVPLIKYLNADNYKYIQNSLAFISAPVAALFILGFFFKKMNSKGAILGLIIGGSLGLFRITIDLLVNFFSFSNFFLSWVLEINFLYFTIFIFITSLITMLFISSLKPIIETRELNINRIDAWK